MNYRRVVKLAGRARIKRQEALRLRIQPALDAITVHMHNLCRSYIGQPVTPALAEELKQAVAGDAVETMENPNAVGELPKALEEIRTLVYKDISVPVGMMKESK